MPTEITYNIFQHRLSSVRSTLRLKKGNQHEIDVFLNKPFDRKLKYKKKVDTNQDEKLEEVTPSRVQLKVDNERLKLSGKKMSYENEQLSRNNKELQEQLKQLICKGEQYKSEVEHYKSEVRELKKTQCELEKKLKAQESELSQTKIERKMFFDSNVIVNSLLKKTKSELHIRTDERNEITEELQSLEFKIQQTVDKGWV